MNHPVVLTYLEEGRDAFLARRGASAATSTSSGAASVRFDGAIDPDLGSVMVECEVAELGTSSLKTRERILDADGQALVEAEFGLVLWDPDRRASRPITDDRARPLSRRRRMSWNSDPVVVTCAITGADVFRENNPNIPYTTEEIANSAIEAGEAGATIAHLHVREDDGTPRGGPSSSST